MRKRLRHLPAGLAAAAFALVACVAVGAATAGVPGALGAAAGVGLAVLSFVLSSVVVAWADLVNPPLILPVGMVAYVLKFAAFGGLLYVASRYEWAGLRAMAAGLAATALLWVAAQAVWVYRSRIPYVDLTQTRGGVES